MSRRSRHDAAGAPVDLTTPRGPVTIRPVVVSEDVAALRDLRLEALRSSPEAFGADPEEEAAWTLTAWAARLQARAEGVTYVADTAGGLAGMAGIVRRDTPKLRHGGTIWGVYVRPAWRRLRIAEALVGACVGWAQGQGMRVVTLAVIVGNPAAIACYARAGFTVYGIAPAVIHHAGVDHDELLMARRIQPIGPFVGAIAGAAADLRREGAGTEACGQVFRT